MVTACVSRERKMNFTKVLIKKPHGTRDILGVVSRPLGEGSDTTVTWCKNHGGGVNDLWTISDVTCKQR